MVSQEQINDLFREAVRYLKRQGYSQKEIVLKAKLGQNTISRIMKGENNAGDDVIQKVAEAYRLNIDFFYGKSKNISLLDVKREKLDKELFEAQNLLNKIPSSTEYHIDSASAINAAIAAKDETIMSLKSQLQTKDETIKTKDDQIAILQNLLKEKDDHIETLKHRVAELRRIIDANQYGLEHLPFPPGVADQRTDRKNARK